MGFEESMKLLTVAIPAYNAEKYLDRCIFSLLNNEKVIDRLEVIIVNDGSVDRTLAIANSYRKKFPGTIKVINKKNGGHGSTINAALSIATGKYFRVLDSDDWFNIIDFPKFINSLDKIDADVILTNYTRELVYSDKEERVKYDGLKYNKLYKLENFNQTLLGDYYFFLATSTYKTKT
jgi:glycosyltransferase involved in cell wall biosynthesis